MKHLAGEHRQAIGGPAVFVTRARVRASRQQQADRLGMPVVRGEHEGCSPVLILGLDLRARVEQGLHLIGLTAGRRLQEIAGSIRRRDRGGQDQDGHEPEGSERHYKSRNNYNVRHIG
jgi:hypothetical protein